MARAALRRAATLAALLMVVGEPPMGLAETPQQAPSRSNLERALMLWDKGEVHEAIELLEAAREGDTLGAAGLTSLGTMYRDTGRRRLAESAFREATRRDRKNAHAWANLASLLEVQARYKEALEAADRAVKLLPEDAGVRSDRAIIHYRLKDLKRAIDDASEAHARAPDDHWHTLNLALMRLTRGEKGDAHTAVRLLEAARRAEPDNDKVALAHAQALLAAMKTTDAIAAYEVLLARNPRQVWACWGRGLAAYRERDWDRARELGDRARKGLPTTFKTRSANAGALFSPDATAYLTWLDAPPRGKDADGTPSLYVRVTQVSTGCSAAAIRESLVGAMAKARGCGAAQGRGYAFSFQVRAKKAGRIQRTDGGGEDEAATCVSRAISRARFAAGASCRVDAVITRKAAQETPPPTPKAP